MKIVSTLALTTSLVLAAFSAEAGTASLLLDQSAKSMAGEQWYRGAAVSQKALTLPNLTPQQKLTALNNLCIFQTKLGQFSDALETCNKSVALGAGQFANYMNRGNLLMMMGDVRAARGDYSKAKELNPSHPVVMSSGFPKPQTPSFVAMAVGDASSAQRAEVGQ